MNSAYMGDVMILIGHHEWEMNMLGTAYEGEEETIHMTKHPFAITCGAKVILFTRFHCA